MIQFKGLQALVVEDDLTMQTIIKKQLSAVGIESVSVSTGVEAIQSLKDKTFDFVIMDINMPEQDGLDATRWIRDMEADTGKEIPIFALTSFGLPQHTKEILQAGMNEHLVKPFSLENFLKVLEKYFR